MDGKYKDLSTAVIVLSAVSLGLQAVGMLAIIFFWSMSFMWIGIAELFSVFSIFAGFVAFYVIASLAVHILALVFAVKGVKGNLRGYILAASIFNAIGLLFGDLISTAGAVCGFILYFYANEDKNEEKPKDQDIDGGLNIYKDNIYGMK